MDSRSIALLGRGSAHVFTRTSTLRINRCPCTVASQLSASFSDISFATYGLPFTTNTSRR